MAPSGRKALAALLGATLAAGAAAGACAQARPATTALPATTLPAATAARAAGADSPHAAAATRLQAGAAGQLPITVDAASSEVDYRANTVRFHQVVIAQGATRVEAVEARATGLNFANSRWTFDGNVRIDSEQQGSLRADQAVVEFRDNRITRATISGKPAQFEQQRGANGRPARGHADEIVYDLGDGTVRLSGDAWLTDGQNEITGPQLVYNVRAQHLQANAEPGGSARVHIRITPHSVPAPAHGDGGQPPLSEPARPESPQPEPPHPDSPHPDSPHADPQP